MIEILSHRLVRFLIDIRFQLARFSLFIVFFWFGLLKLVDISPAASLVEGLLSLTLPVVTFEHFMFFFAFYEMTIGVLFLVPGLEWWAIGLLMPHMATTFLALVLLPDITWYNLLVPTLEGQYIIKNLVIIALAICVAATTKPIRQVRPAHRKRAQSEPIRKSSRALTY